MINVKYSYESMREFVKYIIYRQSAIPLNVSRSLVLAPLRNNSSLKDRQVQRYLFPQP
jgi:hypothetical protein